MTTYSKFSEFLLSKYEERKSRNQKYSLRSFARDLDMSSGRLTNLLKERDIPGLDTIHKISVCLKLEEMEIEKLVNIVNAQKYLKRGSGFSKQLSKEEFRTISDPQTWCVFTLFQCSDFEATLKWFESRTGFERRDILQSLTKLENVGLIEKEESFFRLKYPNVTTTNDIPSEDIRNFHRQFIRYGMESLDLVPVEFRDVSSITMCIDKNNIQEYKKLIAEFRARVDALSSKSDHNNDLYQFNIQFFPINMKQVEASL